MRYAVLGRQACEMAEKEGISCELIDLRTVLPWDFECVANSVTKTGRLVVSCEAPVRARYVWCCCLPAVLAWLTVVAVGLGMCGYVMWQATGSFASEVAATIQEKCFLRLESPIQRVCGYDTPFPLVFEKQYLPDHLKNFEAIKAAVNF